jgi:hypothetical protein
VVRVRPAPGAPRIRRSRLPRRSALLSPEAALLRRRRAEGGRVRAGVTGQLNIGYLQNGRGATTAPFAVQSSGSTHPAPLPF